MNKGREDGCLIVICGIDGSGKTLQSKNLHARLQEEGIPSQYVEFPRYEDSFFGELIARYLRGDNAGAAASPYLTALPFACDRWEFSPVLRQWIRGGQVVVSNRYVTANMAHQGGKIDSETEREEFYRWVEKMEYGVFAVPEPRLHIWLDIEPEHAMQLLAGKGSRSYLRGGRDIHENLQHLKAARKAYSELARRAGNWITVSCSNQEGPEPPEAVGGVVWEQVSAVL